QKPSSPLGYRHDAPSASMIAAAYGSTQPRSPARPEHRKIEWATASAPSPSPGFAVVKKEEHRPGRADDVLATAPVHHSPGSCTRSESSAPNVRGYSAKCARPTASSKRK